ncbi:methyltransferase domain-containing protein [Erythrobacter sp.]|uniref:class I SAM-dependent methyltransferase n=1 Tax=Erythrobacter sp. TaxID=1042 RepID=UPI0025B97653|nr:methyltransferase domain-containing protein [Erythrobacter sp.]
MKTLQEQKVSGMNTGTRSVRLEKRSRRGLGRVLGPIAVFFRGFLEEPRMVGSVIPSSRVTIDAMLDRVDWENCRLFVEYGPGVGTFCPHILERLPKDGKLLVIDTNPRFVDYLARTVKDDRFHARLGSAEDVERFVKQLGHESADFVLSGLPVSTLPEGVAERIVAATRRVLRRGGAFMTYQFRPTARDLTKAHFDRVETDFVWRNVPPCILAWGWKEQAA